MKNPPTLRAWTPDLLVASRCHLVELDADVVRAVAESLPTKFILPEGSEAEAEFRVEMSRRLGGVAEDIARRLGLSGPGLAIVTGRELADLTDDQLTALLFGLSSLLGRPIGQNADEERIVSVVDKRPPDVETARGYLANARMLMHTDPTDAAALLCLRQGAEGGGSVYVSAGAILDVLTEKAPALVHEYFRLWDWDLRGIQRPDAAQIVPTPIFSTYRGELNCRYGSLMLREGARRGSGRLSADNEKFLDLFEEVAQRPDLIMRHTLRRGESLWLNNYRVLHGRDAFEDDIASGRVRRLLRTWIWLHDRPPVPPSYAAFSEAIDREGCLAATSERRSGASPRWCNP